VRRRTSARIGLPAGLHGGRAVGVIMNRYTAQGTELPAWSMIVAMHKPLRWMHFMAHGCGC
jgi:hypothetical protein